LRAKFVLLYTYAKQANEIHGPAESGRILDQITVRLVRPRSSPMGSIWSASITIFKERICGERLCLRVEYQDNGWRCWVGGGSFTTCGLGILGLAGTIINGRGRLHFGGQHARFCVLGTAAQYPKSGQSRPGSDLAASLDGLARGLWAPHYFGGELCGHPNCSRHGLQGRVGRGWATFGFQTGGRDFYEVHERPNTLRSGRYQTRGAQVARASTAEALAAL